MGQGQSVGHPAYMCINHKRRFSEYGPKEYIRCFSPDTRYRREFFHCIGDLALELRGDDLSTTDQVFRLALIKARRSDQDLQLSRRRLRHGLRCWISLE